jgi:membrane protein involved in colicin uptake
VIVRLIVFLSLLLLVLALATSSFSRNPVQSQHVHDPLAVPEDPDRQKLEKEMVKRANQERQAQLRRDTEHLFRLSSELKQYVDKSSEHTLSLEVIKKADEIEKLARSVKEKMKGN